MYLYYLLPIIKSGLDSCIALNGFTHHPVLGCRSVSFPLRPNPGSGNGFDGFYYSLFIRMLYLIQNFLVTHIMLVWLSSLRKHLLLNWMCCLALHPARQWRGSRSVSSSLRSNLDQGIVKQLTFSPASTEAVSPSPQNGNGNGGGGGESPWPPWIRL